MDGRLTTTQAAQVLGCTPGMVREYAKAGWLFGFTMSGTEGRAQRRYFDAAEVEAFRTGGAPAAKAYRERKQKRKVKAS